MKEGEFSGRSAIVTGGAKGIGLAIATRLLENGAKVALWDHDGNALAAATKAIDLSERLSTTVVDVSSETDVSNAHSAATTALGSIDLLVNSAGIAGPTVSTIDYTPTDWQRVLNIDLTGVFLCSRTIAPGMVGRGYGRIVNIASLAGKEGTPNAPAYSAAKAGVIALTKSMGKELAGTGVLVNSIAPAALDTEMVSSMDPAHVDIMISKSPLKRLGTAAECAAMACWLLSEECSFSTGACFDVSGGRTVY